MKQALILFLCLSVTVTHAQKTIIKRGYNGKPYLTYQINANGDYHGLYTKYFDNGIIELQETYVKGKMVAKKYYEYSGGVRYLTLNATYDKTGTAITKYIRTYSDLLLNNVPPIRQVAGILPNGKGKWFYYNGVGDYNEQYNGNDTLYAWTDKTKKEFVAKYVNDIQVLTKAEIEAKLTEDVIIKAKAKAEYIRDSITNVKHMAERLLNEQIANTRYEAKRKRLDSLSIGKKFVLSTDTLYRNLIIKHYESSESTLYNKMVKYLQNKRDANVILQKLITDAIGIKHTELSNYKITTGSTSDNTYGIWANVKGDDNASKHLMQCINGYRESYSELVQVHKDKVALIAIMKYALTNNISL